MTSRNNLLISNNKKKDTGMLMRATLRLIYEELLFYQY